MSVSKRWTGDSQNIRAVMDLYLSRDLPTIEVIAERLGTTCHNVQHVARSNLSDEEYRAHKAVRYSISKSGAMNPMYGKAGDEHHNWKGECEDGRGYLTTVAAGKRRFVHRHVMAEALELAEIPETWAVHHIDGDPTNNRLDNLALCTKAGHAAIHSLQVETASQRLKKSTIAVVLRSMT